MCASLNIIRGVHLIEYTFQVSATIVTVSHILRTDCYWNKHGVFLHSQDDYEGLWNVVAFFVAFVCCVCQVKYITILITPRRVELFSRSRSLPQCNLYLFHSALKRHKAFALWTAVVLCNLYLFGLRNLWQLMFHISVASISTFLTLTRKLQDRSGDCGVWGEEHRLPAALLFLRNAKNRSRAFY